MYYLKIQLNKQVNNDQSKILGDWKFTYKNKINNHYFDNLIWLISCYGVLST